MEKVKVSFICVSSFVVIQNQLFHALILRQNPHVPFALVQVLKWPCFHSPMPFKSAKCRICYHQDAMLLPQSKISHFWSISTTSKYKKEIFLFSKRVLPNSFPIAAWLVGSPFPAGEEKTQTRQRAHMLLTHMRRGRFWSVNFSSAQLWSRCIARSSTFASFDAGFSASSHFHQS